MVVTISMEIKITSTNHTDSISIIIVVTHKYNYTTVKFDPCEEQWTQEISDYSNDSDLNLNCLYSHNKFSKVSTILLYMIQK